MRAKRDYAMLAMLFGCGFRRSELVGLEFDDIQMRQGHWAVVDLIGKGGHIRTVPIPAWAKAALDRWTHAAGVSDGKIFRAVARLGRCGAMVSRRTLCGTWSEPAARRPDWSTLLRMICGEPVRGCAMTAVVNWSRFSSCWDMHPCRPQSVISAANKISDIQ